MKAFFSALAMFAGLVICGFCVGGLVGKVVSNDDMGFGILADALGGMALGAIGGLLVSIIQVHRLNHSERLIVSAVGLLAGAVAVLIARAL